MALRPLVRPGLRRVPSPSGGARLEDLPGGLAVHVSPEVLPLLPLLDGRVEVDAALAASGVEPDAGRVLVRTLALTALLVGTDEAGREEAILARAGGPDATQGLAFQVPTASRFACGRCGACCRGASMGALDDDEVKRLVALGGPAAVALAPAHDEPGRLPLARLVLGRRPDGACVFLEGQATCGVARSLGADARPLGCRVFPWRVQPTPAGLFVSDRLECATASVSGSESAGPPLYEAFDEVRPLLREAARRAPLLSGTVGLSSGIHVPATWARWALARAVEAFDATNGTWVEAFEVARNALLHFEVAAITTDLGPDLWARIWARFEALPAGTFAAPPAEGRFDPRGAQSALARLLAALQAATASQAGGPDLAVLARGLEGAIGWRPSPAPINRSAIGVGHGGQSVERPAGSEDDGLVRRSARQRLSGLPLERDGELALSMARAFVASLATAHAARAAARARGAVACEARDHDVAQPAVVRALDDPRLERALDLDLARALVWGHSALEV